MSSVGEVPLADPARSARRFLTPGLIYTALSMSILSSLGLLLIPSIAVELEIPVSSAQWMLTIYMMVGAVATPIVGRLADGAHTKRLLLVLLCVIVVGSVIAATAVNFGLLLLGRGMQGIGFGIIPITIALVRRYESAARVERSIGALAVMTITGVGIGYPLTGFIAAFSDFRVAFWFAAFFVLTTLVMVWRVVPADVGVIRQRTRFDFAGAALLGTGLASLLLAISEGPVWGWTSLPILGSLIAAVVLLVSWAIVEVRTRYPLVRISLLRHSEVLVANAATLSLGAAMFMGMSVVSIIAQAPAATGFGLAMPLVWAGFVIAPSSLGSFFAPRLARGIATRWSWVLALPIGTATVTAATTFMWLHHSEIWQMLVGMLLVGLGMGMVTSTMPTIIARQVPMNELGSAIGFNTVLRTMGGALGSAISASILAAHLAPGTLQPTPAGVDIALLACALACATVCVALIVNAAIRRLRTRPNES